MNKKIFFVGFLFLVWAGLTAASHKFYVSLTQVDINKESLHLEISARVFTDDLEDTLMELTGQKLRLGTEQEDPKADSVLFEYLLNRLDIRQEGQKFALTFIGKEVEADVIWLYLESKRGVQLTKPIEIRNEILLEQFSDQKNILNLRYGKQTVSEIHSKGHPGYSYELRTGEEHPL